MGVYDEDPEWEPTDPLRLTDEDLDGDFLAHTDAFGRIINYVEIKPLTERQMRPIICKPIPGRDGIEYVPEWFGLTNFG